MTEPHFEIHPDAMSAFDKRADGLSALIREFSSPPERDPEVPEVLNFLDLFDPRLPPLESVGSAPTPAATPTAGLTDASATRGGGPTW
jgi:hypothetical protein